MTRFPYIIIIHLPAPLNFQQSGFCIEGPGEFSSASATDDFSMEEGADEKGTDCDKES